MDEIEQYIKQRRLAIGNSIKGKKKIYLDTNYWILLQMESRESDNEKRPLLNKILALFQSGKCIFPISEVTYFEILKQSDTTTQEETKKIAETLSAGIALIGKEAIIQLQVSHLIQTIRKSAELYDIQELVWDKVSLSEISSFNSISYKDNVDLLNKGKQDNIHKSYSEVFHDEVVGYVDLYVNIIEDEMRYLLYRDKGIFLTKDELNKVDVYHVIHTLVCHILDGKNALSGLQIIPQLFAIHRNNKTQKHKDGNDLMDFVHASFALPFCDYFFTEKGLKSLIKKGKLDDQYCCKVESDIGKVVEILNSIQ